MKVMAGCLILVVGLLVVSNQALAMGKKGRSSTNRQQVLAGSQDGNFESDTLYSSVIDEETPFQEELTVLNGPANAQENGVSSAAKIPVPTTFSTVASEETITTGNEVEEFPSAATVPEPATLALMGMGMAGLLFGRKKQ